MPEAWQVSVLQTAYFLSLRQQLRRDDMMGQYIGNYYPGISHCFSLFRKKGGPGMFAQPIIMKYPGIKISGRPKISIHTAKQERKCAFLFPIPSSFPLGFGGGPGTQPPASAFSALQNALRDPAFLLHSTFACPAGHGMRAKKLRESKTRNDSAASCREIWAGEYLPKPHAERQKACVPPAAPKKQAR